MQLAPESSKTTNSDLDPQLLDPKLPNGYFSHSQYSQWEICGEAYYRKYILKKKTPRYGSQIRGSGSHKGVQKALEAKIAGTPFTMDEGLTVVAEYVDNTFEANTVELDEDETPDSVRTVAEDLFKVWFREAYPITNPEAVEKKFFKKVGTVPMLGFIDLIDLKPAFSAPGLSAEDVAALPVRRVIRDSKTATRSWSQSGVDNSTQLTLYAMVEGTPDVGIDQLVALKKSNKFSRLESTRDNQSMAVFTEHLEETVSLVKAGTFPKASIDSWVCNKKYCSYWSDCRGRKR